MCSTSVQLLRQAHCAESRPPMEAGAILLSVGRRRFVISSPFPVEAGFASRPGPRGRLLNGRMPTTSFSAQDQIAHKAETIERQGAAPFQKFVSVFALAKLRCRLENKRLTNSRFRAGGGRTARVSGTLPRRESRVPRLNAGHATTRLTCSGAPTIYGSAGASPSQAPITARVCLSLLSICVNLSPWIRAEKLASFGTVLAIEREEYRNIWIRSPP
jgi:hypothetical protein